MRRLLLLRHAKAERSQPGERDHARQLASRGRSDARALGSYMARHALVPDLALVSTAARTRETWDLAGAAFPRTPAVRFDERIYEATPATILTAIKETDPKVHTLLVVGHNPGLHELAVRLIATGETEARQRLDEAFPTSALAVIDFPLDTWSGLPQKTGRLDRYMTPRTIGAATD